MRGIWVLYRKTQAKLKQSISTYSYIHSASNINTEKHIWYEYSEHQLFDISPICTSSTFDDQKMEMEIWFSCYYSHEPISHT